MIMEDKSSYFSPFMLKGKEMIMEDKSSYFGPFMLKGKEYVNSHD
jgi:hypothetical protein